jgi:hypothetical protein
MAEAKRFELLQKLAEPPEALQAKIEAWEAEQGM